MYNVLSLVYSKDSSCVFYYHYTNPFFFKLILYAYNSLNNYYTYNL